MIPVSVYCGPHGPPGGPLSFQRKRTERKAREGAFRWAPLPGPTLLDGQRRGPAGPLLWKYPQAVLLICGLAPTGHFVARWEGTGVGCSVDDMINSKVLRSRAGVPPAWYSLHQEAFPPQDRAGGWKVVPFVVPMFDRKGLGAAQRPPPTKSGHPIWDRRVLCGRPRRAGVGTPYKRRYPVRISSVGHTASNGTIHRWNAGAGHRVGPKPKGLNTVTEPSPCPNEGNTYR